MTTRSSEYRTTPTTDEAREYLMQWLMEFGPGEVTSDQMENSIWYMSYKGTTMNATDMQPYTHYHQGVDGTHWWGISQKGLNLLKGEDTDKSTCP